MWARRIPRKARFYWPLLITVLVADCTSKRVAVEALSPPGTPHEVVGDVVRFTLGYNTGGALGIPIGQHGQLLLGIFGLFLVMGFGWAYQRAPADKWMSGTALGLLTAGALGNQIERILSPTGVVDFIDIGLADTRFWTFNIADMGIFCGAVLLFFALVGDPPELDLARSSEPSPEA